MAVAAVGEAEEEDLAALVVGRAVAAVREAVGRYYAAPNVRGRVWIAN